MEQNKSFPIQEKVFQFDTYSNEKQWKFFWKGEQVRHGYEISRNVGNWGIWF
jgi:hypothetical protein